MPAPAPTESVRIRDMTSSDTLIAPIPDAQTREMAGVQVDVVRTAGCRMKRVIYPPGFRWSTDLKPIVGTDLCMHAHVGFLAQGSIGIEYGDGCRREFTAPEMIAVEPGHDG